MADTQAPPPTDAPLLSLITQRYGARLTPEALAEVQQGLTELATVVTALRAVPLANSVEPYAIFIPYRQEE